MNMLRIAFGTLRRIAKDKMVLIWWLVMPLGFVFLFGLVFGQQGQYRTWMPVVNCDPHPLADCFVQQLDAPEFFLDIKPATDEVNVQYWSRAIIIPATFSSDILAGEPVKCVFTEKQGDMENRLAIQANLIHTIVEFTGAMANIDLVSTGWSEEAKDALQNELQEEQLLSVEPVSHSSLRPPPSGFSFTLPSYLVMFTLINTVMYGGISLVFERQNKQILRLRCAPIRPIEIFLGVLLGRMLQPILQCTLLLILGNLLFGVPLGDHPLALIPLLLCFSLCCGAFGILFGSVCYNEAQVNGFGLLISMVLCCLGGCWWPMEIMPEKMKSIAFYTPTYWGIQGLHDVMSFGKSYAAVWPECLILLGFTALLLAVSIPFFQRNTQG